MVLLVDQCFGSSIFTATTKLVRHLLSLYKLLLHCCQFGHDQWGSQANYEILRIFSTTLLTPAQSPHQTETWNTFQGNLNKLTCLFKFDFFFLLINPAASLSFFFFYILIFLLLYPTQIYQDAKDQI
jgi:hypothetical protein